MRAAPALLLALAFAAAAVTVGARELHAASTFPDPALADAYVEVVDGEFVLGCTRFPISGFNMWEVMEAAAGAPHLVGSNLPPGVTGPELIRQLLDAAVQHGMTVVRAWAHGVSPTYPSLLAPGELSEGMLRGLDYWLAEAGKRGIKVILSFTSNWTARGGVDEYANLTGVDHNAFFSKPATKALFQQYVSAIITRTNTITGRANRDDPTIMAWDLINEPVCRDCAPGTIAGWVREMAAFVKGLDPNHLLTVGEEGFYSTTAAGVQSNPGHPDTDWATHWGQDFVADHSDPNIDFAAIHIWPDLWKCLSCSEPLPVAFVKRYIEQRVKDAAALGRPLLLEEFGAGGNRDAYFRAAFDAVQASLASGGPLKGALFWQWYAPGQTASKGEGGGAGQFGLYASDPTFQLIDGFTAAVQKLYSGPAATCTQKGSPAAAACPDKGFEGPACDIDINECVRGPASCPESAVCVNSKGGFSCECPPGTTGSGSSGCANDTNAASAALASFHHEEGGQACDKGTDVPFPQNAIGWADDPTGSFDRNPAYAGGVGARVLVTLGQCAIACQAAAGCDSFTYNPVQQGCFLKTAQCPNKNNCQQPEQTCGSVNGVGETISVPCGTWSTRWKQDVWDNRDAYCAEIGTSGGRVESFGSPP